MACSRLAAPLVLVLLILPISSILGHPVVSYARTGSMDPTLRVGDAFLVDPFVDQPRVGDIILFVSETRGGALAVHRVIEATPDGFVTKGDANALPDQSNGEPLVKSDRIRGRLILPLPGVGEPVVWSQTRYHEAVHFAGSALKLWTILIVGTAAFALALPRRILPRSTRRVATRRPILVKHVALVGLLAVGFLAVGLVAASGRDVAMSVVVTNDPPPNQSRSTTPGASVERPFDVGAFRYFPTLIIMNGGERVSLDDSLIALAPGESARVVAHEKAGSRVGLQEDSMRVWQYPRVLPDEWLLAAHSVAPGIPALFPVVPIVIVLGAWFVALRAGNVPLWRLAKEGPA